MLRASRWQSTPATPSRSHGVLLQGSQAIGSRGVHLLRVQWTVCRLTGRHSRIALRAYTLTQCIPLIFMQSTETWKGAAVAITISTGSTDYNGDEGIRNLRAINIASNSVRISWAASARATGYNIYWVRIPGGQQMSQMVQADLTSYLLEGLQESTTYVIRVAPMFANRDGRSSSISVRTQDLPKIKFLQAMDVTDDSIRLSWPLVTGATSYQLTWRLVSGVYQQQQKVLPANVSSYQVGPLQAGRAYLFIVRPFFGQRLGPARTITERTVCSRARADIVFLMDGSGSIGSAFQRIKEFAFRIVSYFPHVGPNSTQFAAVQYSENAQVEFPLNRFSDRNSVLKAIRTIRFQGGDTKAGHAIQFAVRKTFFGGQGARYDVPRLLVVMTDGRSQDNVALPARNAYNQGVLVFAVGAADSDQMQLQLIGQAGPGHRSVFYIDDPAVIMSTEEDLVEALCSAAGHSVPPVTPTPPTIPCVPCPPGDEGQPGLNGAPGIRGIPGYPGRPGQPGPSIINNGSIIEKGDRGDRGWPGRDGTPGTVGLSGRRGFPGSPGPPGLPGIPGLAGQQGLPGQKGQQGLKGDLGDGNLYSCHSWTSR
uniref:Uncharacterized protein n=2 Tax=Eptatretus burgeri TaxID=7764 RepID=A0A8C4QLD0_EPTBU